MPTTLSKYAKPSASGGFGSRFNQDIARMLGRAARRYVNAKARKWADGTTKKGRPLGSKNKPRGARSGPGGARSNKTGRGYTSSYAGKMAIASSADLNKIKKVRGQGKPRGLIVVNKKKGKLLRQQIRKFNEKTYSTYFIGSNVNMDANNNIGQLDRRYTKPSIDEKHSTGYIFNVGTVPLHWNPQTYGKIGNQILEPNPPPLTYGQNPFYLINGTNTDLEQEEVMLKQSALPNTATPYETGDIPVISVYTVPNTILAEINLNLSFTSASMCDQLLTVQVIRNVSPEPVVPGHFSTTGANGGISNANMIKHLCNHRKNASGRFLEILYTYTTVLKGINLSAKSPKVHYVKKKIKCNYSRSTCRRVSSAAEGTLLGAQLKPHFEIDETGAMFNNCYVRAMATCIDNNVYLNKTVDGMPGGADAGSMGAAPYWINAPQSFDMKTMKDKGQTLLVNARFRYGGTIGVKHYCKETSRGFGTAETQAFSDLQSQLNDLQSQISDLAVDVTDAHDEIDDHLNDSDPHSDSPPAEDTDEEAYTHTHPSAFTDPAVGYDEHPHPGTTTHTHDAVS